MIYDGKLKSSLAKAVELLKSGDVVAFPTETVYGLGANVWSEPALKKIFSVKQRPDTDPLIVHIYKNEQLMGLTENVSAVAEKLMSQFWPGPLTLIFQKNKHVSDSVTAGLGTVAVRNPQNEIARNLLELADFPIAAPSANRFQSISPTAASSVEHELGKDIYILDGGPCEIGMESTVISVVGEPEVLRLGAVTLEDLSLCLGDPPKLLLKKSTTGAQLSPGQEELHYAPHTPLQMFLNVEQLETISNVERATVYLLVFSQKERDAGIKKGFSRIKVLSVAGDLSEATRNLYQRLREIDQLHPRIIVALKVPDRGLGKAINDRLSRASHK